ncbi:FAD-binding oxidoreductase [Kitasatospora camelliae]|uniref:FAD-binding oxidoreductase n=1 Tax=Kitasatospora camelliae TaxID=3156397 RepID=A0AAU8K268_9ACTN
MGDGVRRGRVSRRAVLRWGAGAAAVAGAAACEGGGTAQPSQPATSPTPAPTAPATPAPTPPPTATVSPSPATPADWSALAAGVDGTVVLPGDARYPAASRLYQPQFDSLHPAGVVYPAGAQDVVECLAFARRFGVPVALRSGGHSYAGWSSGPGMVLDVGRLDAVRASGGTAVVGAGARLIDVYAGLAATGATVPAGTCPSVGVTGLTLGGGLGVTCRAYGLTCDSLTAAEVVAADGRVLRVDAGSEPELFWALRGGGGGNFGVVTSLEFRTHPAADCAYGFLTWRWSQAAAVLRAWQAWAPGAPDALWSSLHLDAWPDGRLEVSATVNLLGSKGELSDLIDRLGVAPASASLHAASYLETMRVMGGVAGRSQAQAHLPGDLPGQAPQGRLSRVSYAARSDFFTRALDGGGTAALLAAVEGYARAVPDGGSAGVALDALGGAVNRVGAGDTAFVHRGALFLAQYIANFPSGSGGGPGPDQSRAWLDGVWSAMRPSAGGGAYLNYTDPRLEGWEQAYYGANAARLRQVKRAYDPQGLFHFPQSVPAG